MAFLENCWYAAAWDDEIGEAPLARRILDRPVVLFRGEDGKAAALADRCVHRHAPLSHGRVEGGGIRCGYHGLLFANDGTCIQVPGQTKVPPGARVASFPVVERDRFVWIWMGDPRARRSRVDSRLSLERRPGVEIGPGAVPCRRGATG